MGPYLEVSKQCRPASLKGSEVWAPVLSVVYKIVLSGFTRIPNYGPVLRDRSSTLDRGASSVGSGCQAFDGLI